MDNIFKIWNGNLHFYQWDIGRKLIVNDSLCCEVHFYNRLGSNAIRCEVYEEDGIRLVNVPNILLQEPRFITACVYVINDDKSITTITQTFVVKPRARPDNYVYTETEILTWQSLDRRVKALENSSGASDEQVEAAVKKYLDENPIDVGVQFETDNTLVLKDGVLSVNTTDQMEQDNTLPMTSAGVYATVGNIEVLLKTI